VVVAVELVARLPEPDARWLALAWRSGLDDAGLVSEHDGLDPVSQSEL
jgi:hypothetical protein